MQFLCCSLPFTVRKKNTTKNTFQLKENENKSLKVLMLMTLPVCVSSFIRPNANLWLKEEEEVVTGFSIKNVPSF